MLEKLLPLYRLSSGCDYHRILLPLGYVQYDFAISNILTIEGLKKFNGLLFNRTPLNITVESLKILKEEHNFKVIMDLDDYWELYPEHHLYKRWVQADIANKIKGYIGVSDIITCTTERLADKIREIGSNVHVIPNALPFDVGEQFLFNRKEEKRVRFGFVGGTSHASDLKSIAPIFEHFKHLDFTMCGFSSTNKESIKMRDICSNDMNNPTFKTIAQAPLDKYMYGYDNLDCCIAPLVDKDFNKYKSNLKVLEAGHKKCSIICSPIECYTDTVPDNLVTYCKSIRDWKQAIKIHQDIGYCRERGEKLHSWVKENYNLANINKNRIKLYETLIT